MEATELAITKQEAAELLQSNQQMAILLRGMADMLRMTHERMAALEQALRTATGARSTRETARCDYPAAAELIRTWDDYPTMKAIRAKGGRTSGTEKTEQAGE